MNIGTPDNQLKENGCSTVENEDPVSTILEKVEFKGLAGLGNIDKMREEMTNSLAVKQLIIDFINEHFVETIDFGKGDPRSTKPTLLKPGAEKVCHLFDTHPEWKNDTETWEMLGKPNKTVFLICRIVKNSSGAIIGEGRGAATIGESFNGQAARDTNGAVKICKKRAMVDAALTAFMLSERFTQDLEEIKGFIEIKKQMFEYVQQIRSGCESDLTDNQFVRKVCEREIHKKMVVTKKELDLVWSALKGEKYELETGDKFPEGEM